MATETFEILFNAFWGDSSSGGRWIFLALLALLTRAVFQGWRHLHRYRWEEVELRKAEQRLAAWEQKLAKPAEGSGPPPSRPLADAQGLLEGVLLDSLIGSRITAIAQMRTHQIRVPLGPLQELSQARERARPGLYAPAVAARASLLLGLLGTVFSLTVLLQRLPFPTPHRAVGLTAGWLPTFESLADGTAAALSSLLAGALCCLICGSLQQAVETSRAKVFEHLERFTSHALLPAMVPTTPDQNLLAEVTRRLEESFSLLERLQQQNRAALEEMTAAGQCFSDIVEEIRLITRNEASRDFDRLIEQLAANQQTFLRIAGQLPPLNEAIKKSQERFLSRLSPWRQIAAGLGALWNSRWLGGRVPGPAFLLGATLLILYWVYRVVLLWHGAIP